MKDFEQSYYESLETRAKLENIITKTLEKIKSLYNLHHKKIDDETFTKIMYDLHTFLEQETKKANS